MAKQSDTGRIAFKVDQSVAYIDRQGVKHRARIIRIHRKVNQISAILTRFVDGREIASGAGIVCVDPSKLEPLEAVALRAEAA